MTACHEIEFVSKCPLESLLSFLVYMTTVITKKETFIWDDLVLKVKVTNKTKVTEKNELLSKQAIISNRN